MDQPLNSKQVTIGIEQQPGQRETAPSALETSGGRVEIVVPSTATWSEGILSCKEGSWVGY
jgi:hypothetical protein